MKKNFDFKDLMSFGMFLLALLTFIHLMCQQLVLHKAKPPQNFGQWKGGICYSTYFGQPTLWGGCSFCIYNSTLIPEWQPLSAVRFLPSV